MIQSVSKKTIERLLKTAGVTINGEKPFDIQIHNEGFYGRVLSGGSMVLGETYMAGWWDVEALDEFFYHILSAKLESAISPRFFLMISSIRERLFNSQKKSKAFEVGVHHYDIGNDLYRAMLDKRLTYTCGYWKKAKTLDEAQEHKLDLVCKKLGLRAGQKILDIGCGWGSFLKFAAGKYGVSGVGVTVSKEQVTLGRKICQGLPIEIRFQDYRDLNEKFDHIVSLGMFEHVGVKNYRTYMQVVKRCLKNDGLFLLQTIGGNVSVKTTDPWIGRYIFPNSMLPSIAQISLAAEGHFIIEDLHNFGADYDRTLMSWFKNFDQAWPSLEAKYGRRFYRMWKYYLLSCAGSFRARNIELWQIVLSKQGVRGGYQSIR